MSKFIQTHIFHPSTFPLPTKQKWEKLKSFLFFHFSIFPPFQYFLSSHFSTLPTKQNFKDQHDAISSSTKERQKAPFYNESLGQLRPHVHFILVPEFTKFFVTKVVFENLDDLDLDFKLIDLKSRDFKSIDFKSIDFRSYFKFKHFKGFKSLVDLSNPNSWSFLNFLNKLFGF